MDAGQLLPARRLDALLAELLANGARPPKRIAVSLHDLQPPEPRGFRRETNLSWTYYSRKGELHRKRFCPTSNHIFMTQLLHGFPMIKFSTTFMGKAVYQVAKVNGRTLMDVRIGKVGTAAMLLVLGADPFVEAKVRKCP